METYKEQSFPNPLIIFRNLCCLSGQPIASNYKAIKTTQYSIATARPESIVYGMKFAVRQQRILGSQAL